MNKLTVAALALAAIGFASSSASAQVVTNPYDLVLGFQLSSSPTDLEVDLGSISNLNLNLGQVTNLSSDFSSTDLSNTFGTTWNSTTNGTGVNWSVAGINSVNDGASFYLTSTKTSNVKTNSAGSLSNPNGLIVQLTTGASGQGSLNSAAVAGTSTSALIGDGSNPASGLSQSYTSLEQGNGYTFLSSAEATGATTLTLYSFVPGTSTTPAQKLGTFSLTDTAGVEGLTFTGAVASVPEPSAYALGICAVVLFLVLKRRRSVA